MPSLWNVAFLSSFFWDGRAATLEEQAKQPLLNPVEMANPDKATVIASVRASAYADLFEQVVAVDDNPYLPDFYRDMRTYGLAEKWYRDAADRGVVFIRYSETDFDPEWINQHASAMAVAVGLAVRRVGE